ncbi:hypothetical protein GZ78_19225 [Endozoicomonas numazuensis]|uniref:Phage integrase N-terminal domain-containing protein n=1 Tax=Endozoicomonas numazuensis TaxID=1137799 RepID=A0A081NED4_9GAMM|nr:hypothetical protein [Endozoicomonas numazuensis]KEQ16807.1 hypothetical protein GZ78_19225 [Endozoicomonas numazuensis]
MLAGVSPDTTNHYLAYFRSMFNELERLGERKHENPLKNVKRVKVDERELSYLTIEQIKNLLRVLDSYLVNQDTALVTRICLATGASGVRLRV